VKLRNHPIFAIHHFGSWWPPAWACCNDQDSETLHGEIGVLTETIYQDAFPRRLFMRMEHEGVRYIGALIVDDARLCEQLYEYLQKHLGRTIKEIGDLDIDFLL